jgi:hypothetical protein
MLTGVVVGGTAVMMDVILRDEYESYKNLLESFLSLIYSALGDGEFLKSPNPGFSASQFFGNIIYFCFMMFVAILLVNLLIAIMNGTFEDWQTTATGMWALQFTELLHRCEGMSFPPPFNIVCFIIHAFIQNDIWTKCGIHMYSYRIINNVPFVKEEKFLPNKKVLQTIRVISETVCIGGNFNLGQTVVKLFGEDDDGDKSIKDVTVTNNTAKKVLIYRGSETDYLMPHLITLFPGTEFVIKNVRLPVKWTVFEDPAEDPNKGEHCPELHFENHEFTLLHQSELVTHCSTCGTITQVLKCTHEDCSNNEFFMCLRCYYSVKFATDQYQAEHFKLCHVPAENWWGSGSSLLEDTSQNKIVQTILAKYIEIKEKEAAAEAEKEKKPEKEEEKKGDDKKEEPQPDDFESEDDQ